MTDPFAEYLQNPDRRRLSRFIVAYTEVVTRLVRRIIGCPEASRDVVQDVFLRLAESELTPEGVRYPRTYVLRAALNIAREHVRDEKTRKRYEREAAKLKVTVIYSAEEDVIAREAVERLYRDIDSLPEPLRVAIHLRAVDGLSYKEIGLVTGVPIGTVGSRIREAREELRRLLGRREMAVAWANLELAREHGWFPAATDGLSRAVLKRLKKVAKPARTMLVPAAIVAVVTLAMLGVSAPWVMEGPPEVSRPSQVATGLGERRGVQVSSEAPSVATSERPEKPMAPVVAGGETETSEVRGDEPEPEGTGESPARERKGGEFMNGKTLLTSAALAVGMAAAVGGAETGDFDGDGKLTIRDVVLVRESGEVEDRIFESEVAPGSFEAFAEYPPYASASDPFSSPSSVRSGWISTSVYLESLRRTLSGSFPTYSFMHWPDSWLEAIDQEPLSEDPRVSVRLLPVETTGEPRITVAMELTTTVPVQAFSIAIESEEGLLRVPWVWAEEDDPRDHWFSTRFGYLYQLLRGFHDLGHLAAEVPPVGYLMSGGRYIVTYGIRSELDLEIAPGTYQILTHGRLPRGTEAGTYPLRVLAASQVLLADGTVVSPAISGEGEIAVSEDVTIGWDEGLPPLRFDVENRRVLGKVEFRFADANGMPVPEGVPVARGGPGDTIRFRVQVRTETPLNALSFEFRWPRGLLCTSDSRSLLEQAGEPIAPAPNSAGACSEFASQVQARFLLGGNWERVGREFVSLPERQLEYFKPLGEWIDVWEAVMQIPPKPPLDTIPLRFVPRREASFIADWPRAEFAPYRTDYYRRETERAPGARPNLWEYDIDFHESFVLVEEGQPPEPPDHGIRFALEDVVVPPGEIVEVPVLASAEEGLGQLRLVLEVDPENVTVEAVDSRTVNPETGLVSRVVVQRGESVHVESPDCPPPEEKVPCFSVPQMVRFWETEERFVVIDWWAFGRGEYPGFDPVEIARLVVRAARNPVSTNAAIRPAVMTIGEGPFAVTFESGGMVNFDPDPVQPFARAHEVIGATVHIGGDGSFLRGDVNTDSSLNLSDPVSLLGYLFASGEKPQCLDAADADDNGQIQLTDAIFLLQWLFGMGDAPPPPQECGEDPTEDDVPCDRNVCRRQ